MNNLFNTLCMLFAAAVIIWIPIYFESAWWYLLSWIPGLFIMIVLDGAEIQDVWFGKPKEPLYRPDGTPNVALMSPGPIVDVQLVTPNREEARKPEIGEMCAFWDEHDKGTFRIDILESYGKHIDFPYQGKHHTTSWKYAAPIEPIRFLK